MNDGDFFKDYNSRLRALKAKAVSDMKDYADRYDAIATQYRLTDACYTHGHSNVPGYFEKLSDGSFANGKTKMPNSYVLKGMDNPDAFVKKSDINTPEAQAIREFVAPLLEEAEEARKHAVVTINSVDLTLQNINQLRLLGVPLSLLSRKAEGRPLSADALALDPVGEGGREGLLSGDLRRADSADPHPGAALPGGERHDGEKQRAGCVRLARQDVRARPRPRHEARAVYDRFRRADPVLGEDFRVSSVKTTDTAHYGRSGRFRNEPAAPVFSKAIPHNSARANPEKNCVLMMALFRRNT